MNKSVAIAAALLTTVTGCAGGTARTTGAASPITMTTTTPAAPHRITVTSTAYPDGGTVPRRFTCDGEDVSPPLALSGVPAGTDSLAVTVRDLDAPGAPFTHWLIWGIDAGTRRLSAGERPRGAAEGRNSFGRTGYNGPCPPRGDRPHRYVLTVYATDRRPPLSPGASPDDLRRALSGHTLATGTLTGRYGH
ncbi:YbhB/YbcL family Raf kinase inhibitor-like protein [Streptomyces sp. NPDC001056]